MRRRTLLKGAALTSAAALGAGYWALPTGPQPAAVSLQGARQVLADLQGKTLRSVRGWSPSQVFNHCAQSIDYSIDGYPELRPVWFRHSLGRPHSPYSARAVPCVIHWMRSFPARRLCLNRPARPRPCSACR